MPLIVFFARDGKTVAFETVKFSHKILCTFFLPRISLAKFSRYECPENLEGILTH
jgi:hypothetical protein